MVEGVGQEADDCSLTNGGFGAAMSYFMSPQTHQGLLPSSQGERGAPGTGGDTTTFPENLFPGSGEVEALLDIYGLALESVLRRKPFQKSLPVATRSLTHSLNKHFSITYSVLGTGGADMSKTPSSQPLDSPGGLVLIAPVSSALFLCPAPQGLLKDTKNNIPSHSCLYRWGYFSGLIPWPL